MISSAIFLIVLNRSWFQVLFVRLAAKVRQIVSRDHNSVSLGQIQYNNLGLVTCKEE